MADAKITQNSPVEPLEDSWLYLQEVVDRWARLDGTTRSIHYLLRKGEEGLLRISYLYPFAIPVGIETVQTDSGLRYRTLEGLPEPGRFGIRPSDISRILEGEVFTPDSVLPGTILNYEDESSSVVYMLPTMNMRDPDMKVDNTLKIERLIVRREEIERFELRYGIGEPAPQPDAVPEKLPKVNVLAPDMEADNTLKIELLIVPSAELAHFELMRGISEAPQPAAPDAAPAEMPWIGQARTMYLELKLQHPLQSKEQLAKKMADTGKLKGRGGKPVTAENILRNAIQNL